MRSTLPAWMHTNMIVRSALVWAAAVLLAVSACADQRTAEQIPADPRLGDDARLPGAPLHEQVLSLPGNPPVPLEVTLYEPDGAGPFPLAVMNHGATGASSSNRGERYRFTVSAYYFLSRGYAVALPMMRGFAGSGGAMAIAGCDIAAVARRNGRDVAAVIEALARRPDIDRTKIVVAGQSFGAWNTLGVGANPLPGIRGLISFNAALRSSDCHAQDAAMVAGAAALGAKAAVPSLWFYGDNDSIMPQATWRAVFDSYRSAGGPAELVAFGAYNSDSHQVLSDPRSLSIWSPKVDAFLSRIGLPSAPVYPDYLPHAAPPPTGWADLSDSAAVPYVNEQGRTLYRRFLSAPLPRAFVISASGSVSEESGGYDPLGHALRSCARAGAPCQPYAVNDSVVWAGPKRGDPAYDLRRRVAKTVPRDASVPLGRFFALNPDCSSRGLPRVSISEQPAHGTAAVAPHSEHPSFPPNHPLAACNQALVPMLEVTYTPAASYAGADEISIEEITLDGRREIFSIGLKVM